MRSSFWPALACASLGLCAREVAAQDATPDTAPSFPELFRQAQHTAPRLIELDASVAAAEGRAQQSRAWPNPVAGVELEDVAGTGAYGGTSQSQATLSISEPIELGGQRGARVAAGQAAVRAAEAERAQGRLDFGYDLAMAYAQAEAAQFRAEIAVEDLARAEEDVRAARALVKAGTEAELRVAQAEAVAATAQAELDGIRADGAAALARLSSLAGRQEGFSAVTPSLLSTYTLVVPAAEAAEASIDPPTVRVAIARRDAAERRVEVERKRVIPTPSLLVGVRRIKPDDATTFVVGVSVPLPLFDRNRGEIAAARAELTAAEARERTARLDASAASRAAISQLQAAQSRQAAAQRAEEAAREAYRLARIGYDAGRTPLIEVLTARRTLNDAQSRALDARVARVTAQASLARLSGHIPFFE